MADTLNGKIVNRMRIILRERGMTIRDLAKAIDHYYPRVVDFCSADQEAANLFIMAKVCQALGIQPGDIFIYEANQPAPAPDLEMGEFATWLLVQAGRGDRVGKLAEDILREIKEPNHLVPIHSDIKRDWRAYVSKLGHSVHDLIFAWKEWGEAGKKIEWRNKTAREKRIRLLRKMAEN